MNIKGLTIEEKIGQMIIIGMDTNYITERIRTMIQKYKIGGIILYRKNFETYQDMLKLIKELKELNKENKIPLFIAIDQEGGRVNRMPPEIKKLPSATQIAKIRRRRIYNKISRNNRRNVKKIGNKFKFCASIRYKEIWR